MSNIGISFGSPTSGDGFDVTSTVSQIVATLSAVETPWSTELTSLEAEDTALTTIGTDLGTLSSALESLTDFEGVLSEMEGSSSDTSVLTLTSASTSAVAGSHTVSVQQLAQTSAYYSDAVGSSDLLTGSISIKVNGTTQSITLQSAGETVSALASTINQGDYGVTANVITDSSGNETLSLVSSTSGVVGDITLGGTVTDATTGSTVDFTQSQAGQDAELTVDGVSVTSSSNTVTNAISGVTMQLLSAQDEDAAAVQVVVTNDNTDVESAISTFVSAYNAVVDDLTTQEGDDSSGNPEPLYGSPTLATIQEQLEEALDFIPSENAAYTESSIPTSDVLSGSINISVGSNTAVTVSVPTGGTLADLASAINAEGIGVTASVIKSGSSSTLSLVNSTSGDTISVDGSDLDDETAGTSGTSFVSSSAGGLTSITQLGITMNDDGTLSLNTDTLDSELTSNYAGVVNFFQVSAGFSSFGGNLTTVLDNLGDSTTDGAITLQLAENSSVESQLDTNISNEDLIISAEQSSLTTELNEANETLEEIPEELNSVNELYSAITGYNENQS